MFLLIPGAQGRDLNDLVAGMKSGAEYLSVGGARFRAASTVPTLENPSGGKDGRRLREILIGTEGLGEWTRIAAPNSGSTVLSISGSSLWRLYDQDFALIADSMEDGEVDLAGKGTEFWLVAYGEAGSTIRISR
jgi:hypothetical protein